MVFEQENCGLFLKRETIHLKQKLSPNFLSSRLQNSTERIKNLLFSSPIFIGLRGQMKAVLITIDEKGKQKARIFFRGFDNPPSWLQLYCIVFQSRNKFPFATTTEFPPILTFSTFPFSPVTSAKIRLGRFIKSPCSMVNLFVSIAP